MALNDCPIVAVMMSISLPLSFLIFLSPISSNVSLCNTGTPASSADNVINSVLRRMMDVICDLSSSCRLEVAGVDEECRNVSLASDLFLLVSLLHVADPTRGVTSG